MATKTNTMGLITTVQLKGAGGTLTGTAVKLCGHDSITWEVGTPDEVDITTFCDLDKVNESGMSNEGTLDINFKLLDEKDVGQKLIEDAPLKLMSSVPSLLMPDSFTLSKSQNVVMSTSSGVPTSHVIESWPHKLTAVPASAPVSL